MPPGAAGDRARWRRGLLLLIPVAGVLVATTTVAMAAPSLTRATVANVPPPSSLSSTQCKAIQAPDWLRPASVKALGASIRRRKRHLVGVVILG